MLPDGGGSKHTVAAIVADALAPKGPAAESIADLWWLMLVLGAAVYALVMVLLLGGLFRRRPDTGEEPSDAAPDPARRWVVGGGVVLPAVVLVAVLAATVETMRDAPARTSDEALEIEITGHQWWWEVRYPSEGVTTANELHLPTGRPVRLRLTSADVIHSFWVPELGGKLDLLPDGVNTLVLQADEPGTFDSHCAEFCGLQHANMGLSVVAEPSERFSSWVAHQAQPAAEAAGAEAQRGQELFQDACASCHTVRGTSAEADEGPDLTHIASRSALGAGVVENTPGNLADWVTDPHSVKEGVEMPAVELSTEERADLLAYLGGLE